MASVVFYLPSVMAYYLIKLGTDMTISSPEPTIGNLSTDDGDARDDAQQKNGLKFYSRIS